VTEPADDPLRLARQLAEGYRKAAVTEGRGKPKRPPRPKRPSRDDAVPVAKVLEELVRSQGWTAELNAQRVFTDWAGIVGPEVAQHSQVVGFEERIVEVRASSTAWATQLRLLAPRIVARLNEELGDGAVLRIDIRGPQAPSWVRGRRSVKGRGPRDTYG
jgi:predicted nucleic acid-binding Zn ribbon protein